MMTRKLTNDDRLLEEIMQALLTGSSGMYGTYFNSAPPSLCYTLTGVGFCGCIFSWAVKEQHKPLLSLALDSKQDLQKVCNLPLVN